MREKLTFEQRAALGDFARKQGRQWRLALRDMWALGHYRKTDVDDTKRLDEIRALVNGDVSRLSLSDLS